MYTFLFHFLHRLTRTRPLRLWQHYAAMGQALGVPRRVQQRQQPSSGRTNSKSSTGIVPQRPPLQDPSHASGRWLGCLAGSCGSLLVFHWRERRLSWDGMGLKGGGPASSLVERPPGLIPQLEAACSKLGLVSSSHSATIRFNSCSFDVDAHSALQPRSLCPCQ